MTDIGGGGAGDVTSGGSDVSQHPADQIIRHLVHTGRQAAPDEIEQIVERIATAPFNPSPVRVLMKHRGRPYLGHMLTAREDALTYHLVQRVLVEGQWAAGTTSSQYLSDLRRAVRAPTAGLAVYQRRGGAIAATLTSTADAVPVARRTLNSLPQLLVVYAADRGMILSGYQISGIEATGIPKEARWLR